jgi:hypothetical protein
MKHSSILFFGFGSHRSEAWFMEIGSHRSEIAGSEARTCVFRVLVSTTACHRKILVATTGMQAGSCMCSLKGFSHTHITLSMRLEPRV